MQLQGVGKEEGTGFGVEERGGGFMVVVLWWGMYIEIYVCVRMDWIKEKEIKRRGFMRRGK
jgi:hypothetical protein